MDDAHFEAILSLETGTHTTRINQLLVTRDGRKLISAGEKTIRVWDVETRKPLRVLLGQIDAGANGSIQRMALSSDDKHLVALVRWNPGDAHADQDWETDVRVYELSTGNLQSRFRYPGAIQDLDLSPGGEYVAMVGYSRRPGSCSLLELYDWSTLLQGFGEMPSSLSAWAFNQDDDGQMPSCVRFVPGNPEGAVGCELVVASRHRVPGQEAKYTGDLIWYSFSATNGLTMLPASHELDENTLPDSLAVSRAYVVITAQGDRFFCYDHMGKLVVAVTSGSNPTGPVFSQDGSQLIIGQGRDSALVEVSVYDIALGQFRLKSTYHGHDAEVAAVAFLPDGTAVSAGGDQNAIHFWNPAHFEGEQSGIIKGVGRVVHAVGINADEQIGIGNYDDLRSENGEIILQRVFSLHDMTLSALSIREAAAFQRTQRRAGDLWLEWEPHTGEGHLCLQPGNHVVEDAASADWHRLTTFGFTDRGTIVAGASDGSVQVARRGTEGAYRPLERFLVGHTAAVLDHAASEKWLVTSGADQIIRLWYLDDVEQDSRADLYPALNLFVGSDDEWVIWSNSGYYNASQRGDRRFGYHLNRGPDKEAVFISSDRFIKAFFRPDIIQAIIKYGSEERALVEMAMQEQAAAPAVIGQILPPIVELAENGILVGRDQVMLAFTVEDLNPDEPVTRVWIVRNEQFVWESRARKKKYKVALPLLAGRNRIKILAENERAKSVPLIQTISGPEAGRRSLKRTRGAASSLVTSMGSASKAKGSVVNTILGNAGNAVPDNGILYLLAVGVSDLKHPRPDKNFDNLRFAHVDAIAIYNAFARSKLAGTLDKQAPLHNKAFKSVEATILLNEKATKAAIFKAVDKICSRIRTRARRRSSQRDVLLVFLSGHGVRRTDARTHEQELYFWNHDLDFENTRGTGLSLIDLGRKITAVPADVILTTDACHSGMAGSDVVKGLDPNELAKRIYAINERGMYILNAARSQELALESGRKDIQHGIFTKSILETLRLQSEVNMLELIASVQQRVQYYTGREQTPICRMYGDLLPLVVYQR